MSDCCRLCRSAETSISNQKARLISVCADSRCVCHRIDALDRKLSWFFDIAEDYPGLDKKEEK